MADFTALLVQTDGVGDYHFNRFRVVFKRPARVSPQELARDFITHFPHYFNSEYASVTYHYDRLFDDNPTLEFHGIKTAIGIDIAKPHNDWVVRQWWDPNLGFTAQTLKREFFDAAEDLSAGFGGLVAGGGTGAGLGAAGGFAIGPVGAGTGALVVGTIGGVTGAATGVHANRMHFLAGRRSWRLDAGPVYGLSADVTVLETVAVERFSSPVFQTADSLLGLEKAVPYIWVANLANFIRLNKNGLAVVNSVKPGWSVRGGAVPVSYYVKNDIKDVNELADNREFRDAFPLYRTILP